ncbi:MAG TPA: hypothetical protein PLH48_08855 [Acinetobacter johnsonii]|nr:hypothetical protein [Acinetobacter johnsonii]
MMKTTENQISDVDKKGINTEVLEWLKKSASNMSRMENDSEYRNQVKKFTFDDVKPIPKNVNSSDN